MRSKAPPFERGRLEEDADVPRRRLDCGCDAAARDGSALDSAAAGVSDGEGAGAGCSGSGFSRAIGAAGSPLPAGLARPGSAAFAGTGSAAAAWPVWEGARSSAGVSPASAIVSATAVASNRRFRNDQRDPAGASGVTD